MLRKLGKNYQIAIPREIIRELGLKQEDYIDIYISESKVVLEPKVLIPKDQAYFYSEQWEADEKEAEVDIREARVTKTKNIEELFSKIDK